jgi:hypothetical protein
LTSILTAMKRYGMILADNGSPWFFTGSSDVRWDDDQLNELKSLRGSDFEVVDPTGFERSLTRPDQMSDRSVAATIAAMMDRRSPPCELAVSSGIRESCRKPASRGVCAR